jgi:hypothetical protein
MADYADTRPGFTWLRHPETGGTWECPDGAVDQWEAMGWERTDPPEVVNPAVAARLEQERQFAEQRAAEEKAAEQKTEKATKAAAKKAASEPVKE